jgi:hypothetical protein
MCVRKAIIYPTIMYELPISMFGQAKPDDSVSSSAVSDMDPHPYLYGTFAADIC